MVLAVEAPIKTMSILEMKNGVFFAVLQVMVLAVEALIKTTSMVAGTISASTVVLLQQVLAVEAPIKDMRNKFSIHFVQPFDAVG